MISSRLPILVCFFAFATTGCASWKSKALTSMVGGFGAGYVIGSSKAPVGESKNKHGVLYGSAVSALVGAGFLYFLDEDERIRDKNSKIESLYKQLEEQKQYRIQLNSGNLKSSFSGQKLPKELHGLITPGKWTLYKTDRWLKMSDSTMVHQDRELVFSAPKMNGSLGE